MSGENKEPDSEAAVKNKKYVKTLSAFLTAVFLECALCAGLLLILATVSFRMRFSTEVVRMGITVLYSLPCLLGGRWIRFMKCRPVLMWGAAVGGGFYGILFVISRILMEEGTEPSVSLGIPILCVLSSVAGAWIGKNKDMDRKSDPIA